MRVVRATVSGTSQMGLQLSEPIVAKLSGAMVIIIGTLGTTPVPTPRQGLRGIHRIVRSVDDSIIHQADDAPYSQARLMSQALSILSRFAGPTLINPPTLRSIQLLPFHAAHPFRIATRMNVDYLSSRLNTLDVDRA